MGSERAVLAGFVASTYVFLTALLIAVDWAAATGRLKRNQFVGIRLRSTMRSEQAWVAGHRAALRLTPLHVLMGVALSIAVFSGRTLGGVNLVAIGGAGVFVAVAAITGVIAGKAARAVNGRSAQ